MRVVALRCVALRCVAWIALPAVYRGEHPVTRSTPRGEPGRRVRVRVRVRARVKARAAHLGTGPLSSSSSCTR